MYFEKTVTPLRFGCSCCYSYNKAFAEFEEVFMRKITSCSIDRNPDYECWLDDGVRVFIGNKHRGRQSSMVIDKM